MRPVRVLRKPPAPQPDSSHRSPIAVGWSRSSRAGDFAFAFALLLLALVLVLGACRPPATESGGPVSTPLGFPAVVDRVVDGDTLIVTIDGRSETVRLLGIDTPEKPGGPRPAECFGTNASAFAESLLPPGTLVRLSRDHQTRDQYARLLAYVHRADDELFINLVMVEQGFASPLFFAPNTSFKSQFEDAANAARRNWIGFWPTCGAADVALEG